MTDEEFNKLLRDVPSQFPDDIQQKISEETTHRLHVRLEGGQQMSAMMDVKIKVMRLEVAAIDELTRRVEEELFTREQTSGTGTPFQFKPTDGDSDGED
jgi:hypothetical protein